MYRPKETPYVEFNVKVNNWEIFDKLVSAKAVAAQIPLDDKTRPHIIEQVIKGLRGQKFDW